MSVISGRFLILLINLHVLYTKGTGQLDMYINKQNHDVAANNCSEMNGELAPLKLVYSVKSCIYDELQLSENLFWVKRNTDVFCERTKTIHRMAWLSFGHPDVSMSNISEDCSTHAQGCIAVVVKEPISCKQMNCSEKLNFMCVSYSSFSKINPPNCSVHRGNELKPIGSIGFQTTESVKHQQTSRASSATLFNSSNDGAGSYIIAACFVAIILAVLVFIFKRKKQRQTKKKRITDANHVKNSTSSESLSGGSEEKTSKTEEVQMALMNYQPTKDVHITDEESSIYRSMPYQQDLKQKRRVIGTGIQSSNPTYEMSFPLSSEQSLDSDNSFAKKTEGVEESGAEYFVLEKCETNFSMNDSFKVYLEPIMLSEQNAGIDEFRSQYSQIIFKDTIKSNDMLCLSSTDQVRNTNFLSQSSEINSDANPYACIETVSTDMHDRKSVQDLEKFLESKNVYNMIEETSHLSNSSEDVLEIHENQY